MRTGLQKSIDVFVVSDVTDDCADSFRTELDREFGCSALEPSLVNVTNSDVLRSLFEAPLSGSETDTGPGSSGDNNPLPGQ
jgi:hypothetical protein